MKNIKKIILIFVLSFLFITSTKAKNFTCEIGKYTVEYNSSGQIVGAKYTSDGTSLDKYFESSFEPKNASECPAIGEAQIKFIDGNRTFYVAKVKILDMGGCSGYSNEYGCKQNKFYSCIWNSFEIDGATYNYCNTDKLQYVQCGDAYDIPYKLPAIISMFVNLLKIATPIILIIVSIITLLKATAASNEDEIKKAQKGLIRKVIASVMVFFIISIVQFVMMKVADDADSLSTCLTCFLNNDCGNNTYYKTNIAGEYKCTYFNNPDNPVDCN